MLVEEAGDDIRASARVDNSILRCRLGAVVLLVMYAAYTEKYCLYTRGLDYIFTEPPCR